MNEAEWLASEDPGAMLDGLRAPGHWPGVAPLSPRRLRLFACACCRLCWDRLTDPRSRQAVLVAERYADGLATEGERNDAWHHASVADGMNSVAFDLCNRHGIAWQAVPGRILREMDGRPVERRVASAAQAALLRDIAGSPSRPREDHALCAACGLWFVPDRRRYYLCPGCGSKGSFTRSRLPHPWLTPAIRALALAAYSEGREVPCGRCGGQGWLYPRTTWPRKGAIDCPDCKGTGRTSDGLLCDVRLGILSDALEEAGCREEPLLRHLRGQVDEATVWAEVSARGSAHALLNRWSGAESLEEAVRREAASRPPPGPHARGCWALDLIVGRA